MRRLLAAITISLALGCSRTRGPDRFPGVPVVLISVDTLRADHLPAYGYAGVDTPHLDRLRRDSVLYRNAYSPCPMTLPSHVSMLTGLLPPEHGVRNNVGFKVADATATLPALLKRRGYATGAAVSSYVLRGETGLAAAFADYDDAIDPRPGASFAEYQRPGGDTAARAKAWIDGQRGPFFFFLHLYEPHVPYDPPEPFRSRYASPYDGEIAAADAIVGDFLEHLRALGVYDRAVVVFTSDHGEGLGDHGEDQHSILLYGEAIRVPLLLKLPGSAAAGTRVDAAAQLVDLVPTVAAVLGVDVPGALRGRSLLELARDGGDRPIYGETLYPRIQLGWSDLRSLVRGRHHYIEGPRPELYDVVSDPGERKDLAAADPRTVEALRLELARFPAGRQAVGEVPPEVAARLSALGYVGAPRERGGPLPNPRDRIAVLGRIREALRAADEKRFGPAVAALTSVLRDEPAMVDVWVKLGDVRFQQGAFPEAASAYAEAVRRSPAPWADLLLSLADARLREGKLPEAETAAREALLASPVRAHELLARVAVARGDLAQAAEHAQAAVAQGTRPGPLLLLAEIRARKGDLAEALTLIEQAERRAAEPGAPAVYNLEFVRGDVLARLGRPEEAEAAYQKEIRDFPTHTQAYANLALIRSLQGRADDAERVLTEMTRANPDPQASALAARTRAVIAQTKRPRGERPRGHGNG